MQLLQILYSKGRFSQSIQGGRTVTWQTGTDTPLFARCGGGHTVAEHEL